MSEISKWIRTARCEDIPLREGRSVSFGDRDIAIFNLGGRFVAISNKCPHKGGPLSDGMVAGNTVVCPLHAWKLELDSGEVERPTGTLACVETFRVRVDAGFVFVEAPVQSAGKQQTVGVCLEHSSLPAVQKPSAIAINDCGARDVRA